MNISLNKSQFDAPASDHIRLCQLGELACIQIQHPLATALISLQGAQLLHYTPTGEQPVIWLSEKAEFQRGKAIRGGIPVCWPWFGDARRNPDEVQSCLGEGSLPAHGFVRDQLWLLTHSSSDDQGAHLQFEHPSLDHRSKAGNWPGDARLTLEMSIGNKLNLQLTTTNQSQRPVHFTQALHSYFAVSHIDQVSVQNLENAEFTDTLNHWLRISEPQALSIQQETDRIYHNTPQSIQIHDSGWQRRINVQSQHGKSAVVWNPWIEKSKRLSQFADDAYTRMLCIESANVLDDSIHLSPGESFTLDLTVFSDHVRKIIR